MSIYESKLWISDLDEIIDELPELTELVGKSILITGCTGLICSAIVDVLIRWNSKHVEKIGILAAGRNRDKAVRRFCPYIGERWFDYIWYDALVTDTVSLPDCEYIIHGAGNASPGNIIREPVETILANILGTRCMLDHARNNDCERILYISSSEVYGRRSNSEPGRDNDYGGIDILNPRNSYSIGKCAAETLCSSYYDEYGARSVIVRPGHVYGPTAGTGDDRVSSSWAYSAARGDDIIMKSDGSQIRSYCYSLDCAAAIIKVLLRGEMAHAYNISNPGSIISIRDLANILAELAHVNLRSEQPEESDKKGFNPMNNSSLDGSELEKLGWRGLFDAHRGLSHTVQILKDTMVKK